MPTAELTMNVTEFKRNSLRLLDEMSRGKISRISLTRRGRPIAVVSAPERPIIRFEDAYGCMAGTAVLAPGVNIMDSTFDDDWEDRMVKDWDEQQS